MPWEVVRENYENGETGLHLDEIREHPEILRSSESYSVAELCLNLDL
ncbi:MAG: hypothetical protein ABEJ66_00065 [Candidatus Nanohaloarchaea archaeon]